MKIGMKVGDLMTRNFIYVSPKTNLRECAEIMVKKRVGSLIVKEGDFLKGILTEKDILWAIVKKSSADLNKILAKDLARTKVVTIKPGADVNEALEKMKKEKVRRLPVLEEKKVIGMLTLNDILKINPSLFELIAENVQVKEESEKLKKGSLGSKKKQGSCEECGKNETLYSFDEEWLCSSCYRAR